MNRNKPGRLLSTSPMDLAQRAVITWVSKAARLSASRSERYAPASATSAAVSGSGRWPTSAATGHAPPSSRPPSDPAPDPPRSRETAGSS
ncbi:hypothetical protein FCI23_55205 [Actinacidiphila oryziradicis]|uniref:Uncharacterized protein n=1 Tax=Actinacidiphila oryziradicis TaxID=2571141 RepID=A0A4U0RC78_9ACTN|nr:hypothetical protein FCI23_55205 [Actinacidiphila oryziradicis]